MEGTACFNPSTNCMSGVSLTLPTVEYMHTDGCAVVGGYLYRGAVIPELDGHYFYADYCAGWLRSFRVTAEGAVDHRLWTEISAPRTVSFGRDGAGEVYMVAGPHIWRIVRQ
jgi:hypothetical protein